jgi:predicted DNA-binding protein (MmcQ/YjbR family)
MRLDEILDHCLKKKGVEESFPFDANTLVLKVFGKMFLLTDIENPASLNLKCDPEKAIELREKYDSVLPGYHMNKQHWNTVMLNGTFSRNELFDWIDHSYDLVFNSLPKKVREQAS